MLFAKLPIKFMGILAPLATVFPMFLTSAIAHDRFPALNPQSVHPTRLSQGIDSDNPGLIIPTEDRNWQDIFQSLKQKEEEEPSLSARSGEEAICLVAPAIFSGIKLWHSAPLFMWQGTVNKIKVRSRNTDQEMWSQEILQEQSSILYQGQFLEPGIRYEVFIDYGLSESIRFTLELLNSEEIERIARELQLGEAALKSGGADPETISRYRVRYFMANNLLSDVVQEILAVENPSNDLREIQQNTIKMLCD